MKHCDSCHVDIADQTAFCPLCGDVLVGAQASDLFVPNNPYPNLTEVTRQYNLVYRILLFASLLGGSVSVLVNLLVSVEILWSLIVVAALLYLWITVPPLLRRGVDYARHIVLQTVLTSFLVAALDIIIGWRAWSVNYVVPGLFCAGIITITIVAAFNYTNLAQYVLYQVMLGVFGFIPLLLYLLGISTSFVVSLISAALALASILLTFIFGDRSLKSEFKRRFHL